MLSLRRIELFKSEDSFVLVARGLAVKQQESMYWEKYFQFFINEIDMDINPGMEDSIETINNLYALEFGEELSNSDLDKLRKDIKEKLGVLLTPGLISVGLG